MQIPPVCPLKLPKLGVLAKDLSGTRNDKDKAVFVTTTALVTELVRKMPTANASQVWMEKLSGLVPIALFVLAHEIMLGLEALSMPMMCILGLSAQTKEFATASWVFATASLVMMELHAKEPSAQKTVTTEELAGLRSISPPRPTEFILPHGMP